MRATFGCIKWSAGGVAQLFGQLLPVFKVGAVEGPENGARGGPKKATKFGTKVGAQPPHATPNIDATFFTDSGQNRRPENGPNLGPCNGSTISVGRIWRPKDGPNLGPCNGSTSVHFVTWLARRSPMWGIDFVGQSAPKVCVRVGHYVGPNLGPKTKNQQRMPQLLRHAFSVPFFVSNSGPKSWPRNHVHGLNPL